MFGPKGWLLDHWRASELQTPWLVELYPLADHRLRETVEVQACCYDHAVNEALATRNISNNWGIVDVLEVV